MIINPVTPVFSPTNNNIPRAFFQVLVVCRRSRPRNCHVVFATTKNVGLKRNKNQSILPVERNELVLTAPIITLSINDISQRLSTPCIIFNPNQHRTQWATDNLNEHLWLSLGLWLEMKEPLTRREVRQHDFTKVYKDLKNQIERDSHGSIVPMISQQDLNDARNLNKRIRFLEPKKHQIEIPEKACDRRRKNIYLTYARLGLKAEDQIPIPVKIILDSGVNCNVIGKRLVDELGLEIDNPHIESEELAHILTTGDRLPIIGMLHEIIPSFQSKDNESKQVVVTDIWISNDPRLGSVLILGQPWIQKNVSKIDFPSRTITLLDGTDISLVIVQEIPLPTQAGSRRIWKIGIASKNNYPSISFFSIKDIHYLRMVQLNIFDLPELLERILYFLEIDHSLYSTLFVNHLWYHCSAPILWQHIEFIDYKNTQYIYTSSSEEPVLRDRGCGRDCSSDDIDSYGDDGGRDGCGDCRGDGRDDGRDCDNVT
ncbi:hypothetical protein Glove_562g22 [Diversispora epigaea]|uniref:F-box domain-containing protein n=1 Tax=Diversispora epigaea TaxID=1348612 RepID=A0A397GD33_9GLOM|nr:hypothetical protein Glove_562g22 [Diversispora epigaea]